MLDVSFATSGTSTGRVIAYLQYALDVILLLRVVVVPSTSLQSVVYYRGTWYK